MKQNPNTRHFFYTPLACIGAVTILFVIGIVFILVSWSWPEDAVVALFGGTTFVVTISITAALVGRRIWSLATVSFLITLLPIWWILSTFIPNPKRDRKQVSKFLQMEIPQDANSFRWERSRSDQFGDHSGVIRFQASPDSLRQLATQPLFGKHKWKTLSNGNSKVTYEQTGQSHGEGWIKPEEQSFYFSYATY